MRSMFLGAVLAIVLLPGCRGPAQYTTQVAVSYTQPNGVVTIIHTIGGAR
jgi:hypothetical protein